MDEYKSLEAMDDLDNLDETLWELLNLYLDGETTPAENAQVEALLASDVRYAREFSLMKRGSTMMQAAPQFEPPARLREAIFAQTIDRPTLAQRMREIVLSTKRRSALLWLTGMGASAALALVLLRPTPPTANVAEQSLPTKSIRVATNQMTNPPLNRTVTETPALTENHADDLNAIVSKMETQVAPTETAEPTKPTLQDSRTKPVVSDTSVMPEARPAQVAEPKTKPSKQSPKTSETQSHPTLELASTKETSTLPVFPRTRSVNSGESFYSKKPMMDTENQRPVQPRVIQVADSRTDDEATPTDPVGTSGKASSVAESGRVITHVASNTIHVPTLSDLKTNEEMRREESHKYGGYGAITRAGIQSQQIQVGFTAKL